MIRKSIHVVPKEGMWAVKSSTAVKASRIVDTQAEARALAREMAIRSQAELVVHRRNGTIGEKNSYFKPDPMPPRG